MAGVGFLPDDMADFGDYVKDYDEGVLPQDKQDRKHVEFSLCHTFAKARQALRGQSPPNTTPPLAPWITPPSTPPSPLWYR
jgi:hypothetical protein